jgi:hypothetical protein
MAILGRSGRGAISTFQPGQAPLGAWLHRPEADVAELLHSLLGSYPGFALLLGVTQQDPDLAPRPAQQPRLVTMDYIRTARISVDTDFAGYWRARGKNLRHSINRQQNLLARSQIAPRVEVVTEPDRMKAMVADYGRIESAGWKAASNNAVHADNVQGRFYAAMLRRFAEAGQAAVVRCWYGDKLAACDLCIHRDGVFVILKTTYDESERTTSPAHLMRHIAFKPIFDERRYRRIEFYGRVMDWHTKWSNEIRTMYHVNFYRWPILKALHAHRTAQPPQRAKPAERAAEPASAERRKA